MLNKQNEYRVNIIFLVKFNKTSIKALNLSREVYQTDAI